MKPTKKSTSEPIPQVEQLEALRTPHANGQPVDPTAAVTTINDAIRLIEILHQTLADLNQLLAKEQQINAENRQRLHRATIALTNPLSCSDHFVQ